MLRVEGEERLEDVDVGRERVATEAIKVLYAFIANPTRLTDILALARQNTAVGRTTRQH